MHVAVEGGIDPGVNSQCVVANLKTMGIVIISVIINCAYGVGVFCEERASEAHQNRAVELLR